MHRRHRILGLGVESDFPFETNLLPGTDGTDVTFSASARVLAELASGGQQVYASTLKTEDGTPLVELKKFGKMELLRFAGRAEFLVRGKTIEYSPLSDRRDVEGLFLGSVLAYYLERLGVLALHASAVAIDGEAVAFVGPAGTGKSSLAAAFVGAEHSLLTDDVLAVRHRASQFVVEPSVPELKLNPDAAGLLIGSGFDRLEKVHPLDDKRRVALEADGPRFSADGKRLRRVFVLRRQPHADCVAKILQMGSREAVMELLKASFTPNLVEAVGLSEARLDKLSSMVENVQVEYLDYQSGFPRLPEVVDLVARELEKK